MPAKGGLPPNPFQKGNPGKPKGAVSKKTEVINAFTGLSLTKDIHRLMEGELFDKFVTELNKLEGAQFVNAYNTMLEYVKPKLSRTEIVEEKKQTVIKIFGKQIKGTESKQLTTLQNTPIEYIEHEDLPNEVNEDSILDS